MDLILVVALVVVVAVALLGAAGFWIDAGADRQEGI
jgi:nitrate reductase NapE component